MPYLFTATARNGRVAWHAFFAAADMEQELRLVFDHILSGEMAFDEFLETFRSLMTAQVEKEVQEFDECLSYLVQPEIKV